MPVDAKLRKEIINFLVKNFALNDLKAAAKDAFWGHPLAGLLEDKNSNHAYASEVIDKSLKYGRTETIQYLEALKNYTGQQNQKTLDRYIERVGKSSSRNNNFDTLRFGAAMGLLVFTLLIIGYFASDIVTRINNNEFFPEITINQPATNILKSPTIPAVTQTSITNTVEAIPSATITETLQPVSFFDSFEDNRNGWILGNGATITNGILQIDRDRYVVIPGVEVGNFYIELDVMPDRCGIRFEDASIGAGSYSNGGNWHRIYFVTWWQDLLEINYINNGEHERLDEINTVFDCAGNRIGLQYRDGEVEIYIDNILVAITQFVKEGNEIVLDGSARFDNILIRESR